MKRVVCFLLISLAALASALSPWTQVEECVDLTEARPCQGRINRNYPICEFCQFGYFAQCEDDALLGVRACPLRQNEDGERVTRLIFDVKEQICVEDTPFCERENSNTGK